MRAALVATCVGLLAVVLASQAAVRVPQPWVHELVLWGTAGGSAVGSVRLGWISRRAAFACLVVPVAFELAIALCFGGLPAALLDGRHTALRGLAAAVATLTVWRVRTS